MSKKRDPAEVFRARCEAKALLVHNYELELTDAIGSLQASAKKSGLTRAIGQDRVQQIIADALRGSDDPEHDRNLEEEMHEVLEQARSKQTEHQENGDGRPEPPPISEPPITISHIKLIAFDDVALNTERRYLVQNIIPRVGLVVVWGPPKCGKSFWTFDRVMHIALGRQYRNRHTEQGVVVYGAFEGAEGFKDRIIAYRQRHLAEHTERVPFYLEPMCLDLVRDHKALIATIKITLGEIKPAVVVLDTLNRSLRGSESSDEDMTAYINAADVIRAAFECAVIIIHHCGIDGTRPRGHTSLTGTADAQIAVKRDAASNVITLVEYMKDGPEGEAEISRLEPLTIGVNRYGIDISSCVVVPVGGVTEVSVKNKVKPKKMPDAAKIALAALREAINDLGAVPSASNHIPQNTKTVTVDQWRDYAERRSVSGSDKYAARYRAFKRSTEHLISEKIVAVWTEQVWIP